MIPAATKINNITPAAFVETPAGASSACSQVVIATKTPKPQAAMMINNRRLGWPSTLRIGASGLRSRGRAPAWPDQGCGECGGRGRADQALGQDQRVQVGLTEDGAHRQGDEHAGEQSG